jgi:inosine-uridine nucleoside N-ribohydrolase
MPKIHLDTDIGGDMDDLCALAMLLKWPDLEITGVTTVSDERGRRAGYARYVLNLMGRTDIPVAAGADVADGHYHHWELGYPPDEENWPEPVPPRPGPIDEALSLLQRSIEQGAILVGIGPFTNFRLLDEKNPGILRQADLFLMGGHVYDNPPGFPQWPNDFDYNIQVDVRSAHYVLEHANPTLIPLAVSCQTALRRAYLPRLAQAGRLGELIVRQAELFARTEPLDPKYGATCPGLPRDIINFQHDPLACAIALGWHEGVEIESVPLKFEVQDNWLYEIPAPSGIATRLVTKIDGNAFNQYWCDILCR